MSYVKSIAICADNYKSFAAGSLKLTEFNEFNIIVGRNNSGKSSILELIEISTGNSKIDEAHFHKGNPASLLIYFPITERDAKAGFPDTVFGGIFGGNYWDSMGKRLVDNRGPIYVLDPTLDMG